MIMQRIIRVWSANDSGSRTARRGGEIAWRSHPLLRSLGGQREEMVQSGRHVRQIYQPCDLRADGLLATSSVSTEMPEPVRVGQKPDRRDTIVRSEPLTAEHAGRVLVGARGFPLVAHNTLAKACARPNARSAAAARARTSRPATLTLLGSCHAHNRNPDTLVTLTRSMLGASLSPTSYCHSRKRESSMTKHQRRIVMLITNKTILITGANRGIGRGLVDEALAPGAKRVCAGPRGAIYHPDNRVTSLTLDVTSASQIERAVGKVDSLDLLINNAGVAIYSDLSNLD